MSECRQTISSLNLLNLTHKAIGRLIIMLLHRILLRHIIFMTDMILLKLATFAYYFWTIAILVDELLIASDKVQLLNLWLFWTIFAPIVIA